MHHRKKTKKQTFSFLERDHKEVKEAKPAEQRKDWKEVYQNGK
jgi:hypothetical protein